MFQFFASVSAVFSTVVNFVINAVEMVVIVVINVGRGIVWLFACLSYLPPWLVSFVAVPLGFAVVTQIINKGS